MDVVTSQLSISRDRLIAVSLEACRWICLIFLFRVMLAWFFSATKLSEANYFEPVLLWTALTGPRAASLLGALALIVVASAPCRWSDFHQPQGSTVVRAFPVRGVIVACAAVMAWSCGCYEYNFYFDRWHGLDRLIVMACAALTIWRPVFASLTLISGLIVMHQFEQPVPGFTWTDKRILFDVLILFQAHLLQRRLVNVPPQVFIGVLLSMIGANYFGPAWAKIQLNWLNHEQLHHLFVSSYFNGWLSMLSADQVLTVATGLRWANLPLIVIALATELAVIAIFCRRRACVLVLLSLVALHLAILATSGIFFWKWILVDLILAGAVGWMSREVAAQLFSRTRWVLSVIMIASSPILLRPFPLGWYDTRLTEHYRFVVETEDGRLHEIPRLAFAPYDVIFAQSRFHWLHKLPTRVGTYGSSSSLPVAGSLNAIDDVAVLNRLHSIPAESLHRPENCDELARFLRRFLSNQRASEQRWTMPRWLTPPPHILSFSRGPTLTDGDVRGAQVRFVQQLYLDDRLVTVQDTPVFHVPLKSPAIASRSQ